MLCLLMRTGTKSKRDNFSEANSIEVDLTPADIEGDLTQANLLVDAYLTQAYIGMLGVVDVGSDVLY